MRHAFALMVCIALTGCAAHYTTPGRGAQLEMFGGASKPAQDAGTDGGIREALEKKPLASFPASVAVARVQEPGYCSYTARGWGSGHYSVVTTRDIETEEDLARLAKLSHVRGVAPLNRLIIPSTLQSDYELRHAAAKMHADVLLIYTLDTTFQDFDRTTPLSIVTLGATNNKRMRIFCTASAALLDTRSGYVYGLAEATKNHEEFANAWKTESEIDARRRDVETKAFAQLIDEVEKSWNGVVREYAAAR